MSGTEPDRTPAREERAGARRRLGRLLRGAGLLLVAAVVLTWHLTGGAAATDLYGVVVHTLSEAR